jgi:hypothetical protein
VLFSSHQPAQVFTFGLRRLMHWSTEHRSAQFKQNEPRGAMLRAPVALPTDSRGAIFRRYQQNSRSNAPRSVTKTTPMRNRSGIVCGYPGGD